MALQSFKDLTVWQKAQNLSLTIYREFATCRDYGFKDQIQRAGISITNNIAEGYGRRSNRALGNFLTIARGSVAEVESMLLMAHKLGYIR
jgi:four helix bundle protein